MLTDEQIENWRTLLCLNYGAYALIMPREEIEEYVQTVDKKLYEFLDKLEKSNER